MIIDFHAHTSKSKMYDLHTECADINELKNRSKNNGISKIVLMATYFPFKGTGLNNLELLKRIDNEELFCAFGSLDVMNNLERGLVELKDLAKNKKNAE